jgi:hypothetical protein
MSELLKQAFEKVVSELPECEQDAFAQWLLKLIESDEREWEVQFAGSAAKLEKLADQALAEYLEGCTEILDVSKL